VVIANGLRHGTRAALTKHRRRPGWAGDRDRPSSAIGLTSLMATMGYWFGLGALCRCAYLVWLGLKLIRAPVVASMSMRPPPPPRRRFS